MSLRQLDLTPALRPSLYDDETLIFVQDSIGLYDGKFKLQDYQDGHAYLTTHRICYIGNEDPRAHAVAIDLKDVGHTDFYAGFLKSSAKITLWPKSTSLRTPIPRYSTSTLTQSSSPSSPARSHTASPAPARDVPATWICPICGLPNTLPSNFDPSTANQHTKLAPCQACGVTPPLALVLKASIAAKSQRMSASFLTAQSATTAKQSVDASPSNICPRCTFENYPSLTVCEVCGASLSTERNTLREEAARADSPGPARSRTAIDQDSAECIKLAFRAGGEKKFLEKLKEALIQRRWLLESAPPIPQVVHRQPGIASGSSSPVPSSRIVGIAGLEQQRAQLREKNQTVMGNAFGDLEALMTSAKEVIAMAEQFRDNNTENMSVEDRNLLSDSATALGLTTEKEMFAQGSSSEVLYISELARNLAEYLTDDKRGVLRKEGGIMSLVDLWAVFNKSRNGMELVSPSDFEKAARAWDTLHLPVRLRQFKSGLLVVQERSRTDDKTIAALLAWLQQTAASIHADFGRSATAQQTAEHFGWSVGVATEELEMAEEAGILVRDQTLDGVRFWQNFFDEYYEKHVIEGVGRITVA